MSNLGGSVNIRLDAETEKRLGVVASRFGVKASMLVRNALREYLEAMEGRDSLLIHALPLNESVIPLDSAAAGSAQRKDVTFEPGPKRKPKKPKP